MSQSNIRTKTLTIRADTTLIDSSLILFGSLDIEGVNANNYTVDYVNSTLIRHSDDISGEVKLRYRILDFEFKKEYFLLDTTIIASEIRELKDPFKITVSQGNYNDFFGSDLAKEGSISRGVGFGNNQNLSVNSNLNLQLTGKIAPEVGVLASVTDDNIPIQPEGNTQQLQDFDQVYIKVFNEGKWDLVAGDFWLKKPQGYFMTYNKRAQGGSVNSSFLLNESSKTKLDVQASGAISKGKFARNVLQGIEGNQGP